MAGEREGQEQAGERPGSSPDIRAQRHESRTAQTYTFFLRDLEKRAGVDRDLAERAAQSVLCLVEQRILDTEAKQLEAQLPEKVRQLLKRCAKHEGKPAKKYGLLEFLSTVADELDTTPNEAERLARAVLGTVREHITEGEAEDVIGQLPADLQALWAREA